jgi:hypothetical protein
MMGPKRNTIHCKNPDPGKQGTDISRRNFEMVRRAILAAIDEHPRGLTSTELMVRVRERLTDDDVERLGSVSWHTTVVKLHLEAESEIERDTSVRPTLMRRPEPRPPRRP